MVSIVEREQEKVSPLLETVGDDAGHGVGGRCRPTLYRVVPAGGGGGLDYGMKTIFSAIARLAGICSSSRYAWDRIPNVYAFLK